MAFNWATSGFTPADPNQNPLTPGYLTLANGQRVFGTYDPLGGAVKTYDPSTGQKTGQWIDRTGKTGADNFVGGHSAGDILKHMAIAWGVPLGVGALGSLGAPAAAADSVGPGYASDAAAATSAHALSSLPSAASTLGPTIAKLATGGAGLGLSLAARNQADQQNAPLMSALNQLLPQLQQRFNQTQPLFGNVVNMAHGMLPKAYQ